jgi:hypothetical protein
MPLAPPRLIQSRPNFGCQPLLRIEFPQVQSAMTRPSPASVPEEAAPAAVELESERFQISDLSLLTSQA